ncbi:dienelactone hydrolase family protein [Flavobacteriaceae bacterium]|jgi:dienelactone hydrolase|nr:dienelactone hydrolase family protein [Flavobacteriaceae bacterium]|tara:strand:+ start:1463 stop:2419 length:957 start_codon:yes stop_codon:yes gene_type:complete
MKKYLIILLISLQSNSQNLVEKIIFKSANPFSFHDVITDLKNQETQEVFGNLVIPYDSLNPEKKYPLVFGVAGSLGWKKHHYEYLIMYQDLGFATFELNSFKSRRIESTVGDQTQVTTAAMVLDAYKALEILSDHPNILKNKISITGWSLGGAVTLFSAWIPLKNAINKDLKFASHLAFYPPCFFEPSNLEFTNSPIHILIGELDDWTPSDSCNNLVDKLKIKSNIGLTIYKDSHHGFDRDGKIEINENGYSFKDCIFKLTDDGYVLMNYLNIPMSNSFLQKIGFLFCTTRGVTIGGNKEARKNSFLFAKEFMTKTLL